MVTKAGAPVINMYYVSYAVVYFEVEKYRVVWPLP